MARPSSFRVRSVIVAILLCGSAFLAINSSKKSEESHIPTLIHPQVFKLILCWDSDTISPVATEINLEAVYKNNDQFDYSRVTKEKDLGGVEWIVYTPSDQRGYTRYRIVEQTSQMTRVIFNENGGGSYTSQAKITYQIVKRSVQIEGKKTDISVLRVLASEGA
jgi:hypothetical protein